MVSEYRSTAKLKNKYDGRCVDCGHLVPAGKGVIFREYGNRGRWLVAHPIRRTIHPSGPWDKWEPYEVGGCPDGPVIKPEPTPVPYEEIRARAEREFAEWEKRQDRSTAYFMWFNPENPREYITMTRHRVAGTYTWSCSAPHITVPGVTWNEVIDDANVFLRIIDWAVDHKWEFGGNGTDCATYLSLPYLRRLGIK